MVTHKTTGRITKIGANQRVKKSFMTSLRNSIRTKGPDGRTTYVRMVVSISYLPSD